MSEVSLSPSYQDEMYIGRQKAKMQLLYLAGSVFLAFGLFMIVPAALGGYWHLFWGGACILDGAIISLIEATRARRKIKDYNAGKIAQDQPTA